VQPPSNPKRACYPLHKEPAVSDRRMRILLELRAPGVSVHPFQSFSYTGSGVFVQRVGGV
jgi:hypothetical protein